MTNWSPQETAVAEIRKLAEARMMSEAEPSLEEMSKDAVRSLIHELRVHQIELEMQNEELRRTQSELEDARARYFDLFDLAPVGYFTLGLSGLVMEANFTLSTLLGINRDQLVGAPFTQFIMPDDQDLFYLRQRKVIEQGLHQGFELRLRGCGGNAFWVRLEARVMWDADGKPCFAPS